MRKRVGDVEHGGQFIYEALRLEIKPPKTHKEQIEILKPRGCVHFLKNILKT
jgi:hypothetical protein